MSKTKSTFTSYIIPSLSDPKTSDIVNSDDFNDYSLGSDDFGSPVKHLIDAVLQPNFLSGEKLIVEVDGALRYEPYSKGRQGMSGKLRLTNFKLSFVTTESISDEKIVKRRRNRLLNENDIPLSCIDAIYLVMAGGKRRKLTQEIRTSLKAEDLTIHCKDLRVHQFSFKSTPTHLFQKTDFINHLIHHAFVVQDSCLFALEYGRNLCLPETLHVCNITFESPSHWLDELCRCGCESEWRVTEVNVSFDLSQYLPQYFVVSSGLCDNEVQKSSQLFVNRMLPTWRYTHTNKTSLLRMSALEESDPLNQTQKMLDAVKDVNNQRNLLEIVDMADWCPSCKDTQNSYSKLKKLCISDTEREFHIQDLTWYSSLEDTKWLQLVAQCLRASAHVTDLLVKQQRSVILQEQNGCDFSCLVSSLVQILLDRHFRTLVGFQSLIEKEWVRMGHPFQNYLALVVRSDGDREEVPIFLLFLDCVWQLLQQFPSSFEMTEIFLTTIWDTAHVGIFSTFLFNNDHHRLLFSNDMNIEQFKLPVAWNWDMQFNVDLLFFKNPLYHITQDHELLISLNEIQRLSVVGQHCQSKRHSSRHRSLPPQPSNVQNDLPIRTIDVLQPYFSTMEVHLWSQNFLRWQRPAQIFCGGLPSSYLRQCRMVEEIISLQSKVKQLQLQVESSIMYHKQNDQIFGHQPNDANTCISELLKSTCFTTSFPFSPVSSMKRQQ